MITLYSNNCPKCKILVKKLTEKNIDYTKNQNVEEMVALGISRVPVLKVDGEMMEFGKAIQWINNQ